jgi:hypothetical protein
MIHGITTSDENGRAGLEALAGPTPPKGSSPDLTAAPETTVAMGYIMNPNRVLVLHPNATGHKIALCPLARGATVIKYGQPIGVVTQDIGVGEHVHIHNVASARAG